MNATRIRREYASNADANCQSLEQLCAWYHSASCDDTHHDEHHEKSLENAVFHVSINGMTALQLLYFSVMAGRSCGMKCAGVRQAANGKLTECKTNGKLEYDWFCSYEHQREAKQYAADAYDAHAQRVNTVAMKKALIPSYNTKIRPAFISIIMANKRKEEAEFVLSAGVEYTAKAKQAWINAEDTYSTDSAGELKTLFADVTQTKQSIKRKLSEAPDLSLLNSSQEFPETPEVTSPLPSPVQKKAKVTPEEANPVQVKPEPVDDPNRAGPSNYRQPPVPAAHMPHIPQVPTAADLRTAEELMQAALNAPLPNDDDMEFDE
jgi:hypothetical protein